MFESLKNLLKHFTGNQESESPASPVSATNAPSSNSQPSKTNNPHFHTLGEFNLGLGTIGPTNRNDIDQQTLIDMYQAIAAGTFNIPTRIETARMHLVLLGVHSVSYTVAISVVLPPQVIRLKHN